MSPSGSEHGQVWLKTITDQVMGRGAWAGSADNMVAGAPQMMGASATNLEEGGRHDSGADLKHGLTALEAGSDAVGKSRASEKMGSKPWWEKNGVGRRFRGDPSYEEAMETRPQNHREFDAPPKVRKKEQEEVTPCSCSTPEPQSGVLLLGRNSEKAESLKERPDGHGRGDRV